MTVLVLLATALFSIIAYRQLSSVLILMGVVAVVLIVAHVVLRVLAAPRVR